MTCLFLSVVLTFSIGLTAYAQTSAPVAPPATQPGMALKPDLNRRLLIVSIDGLRPDLLVRAKAPTIRWLIDRGAFSMWARTTKVAITLPSHVSMLTGMPPEKHKIDWNSEKNAKPGVLPATPTVLDLAHQNGYRVAMATGKLKFDLLARAGTLAGAFVPIGSNAKDVEVAKNAARIVSTVKPNLMFVHFPGADGAGHGKGWGSPEQIAAVENIDTCLEQMLATYRELGWLDSMYILLSADHGGTAKGHGGEDARSKHIPWILVGPDVKKGYDLTRVKDLVINTEDTFATACRILGINLTYSVDGKPVESAFQQDELLQDK